MSIDTKFITVFSTVYYYTVGMLFMLNLSEPPWFFGWLVLMHVGILAFILTKKKFKSTNLDMKNNYRLAYLSLLLFVPVLIYKIIVAILKVAENEMLIHNIIYVLIGLCVITGIFNMLYFKNRNKHIE